MSDDKYIIGCCGVVDKWEARFYNVSGTRTVYFQVWRPDTAGSSTMELVGQNSMTVCRYPLQINLFQEIVTV
jgi:hypothetical protein